MSDTQVLGTREAGVTTVFKTYVWTLDSAAEPQGLPDLVGHVFLVTARNRSEAIDQALADFDSDDSNSSRDQCFDTSEDAPLAVTRIDRLREILTTVKPSIHDVPCAFVIPRPAERTLAAVLPVLEFEGGLVAGRGRVVVIDKILETLESFGLTSKDQVADMLEAALTVVSPNVPSEDRSELTLHGAVRTLIREIKNG